MGKRWACGIVGVGMWALSGCAEASSAADTTGSDVSDTDSSDADTGSDGDTGREGDVAPDADTGPDGDDAGDTAVVLGDPDVLVGSFQVTLVPPVAATAEAEATPGFTSVYGKVYDGPTPSSVQWEEVDRDGDCVLWVPRVPSCTTRCGSSALCVDDEVCQSYPTAHPVGEVTFSGITTASGDDETVMKPVANAYQPSETLPFPAFTEGARVLIKSGGGDYAKFTIEARGIVPLVLTSGEMVLDGESLALTWTAGAEPSAAITVKLDISHHGGTRGVLTCATADDGALDIAARLVAELLDLGVSGLPTIVVTRSATGVAVIEPGRVELVLASIVEEPVTVPGLVSCTDDSQCPEGTTCQDDLACR